MVSEPHSLACGTCHLCRRGFAELCASKRSPGWGIDGAFADRLTMPAHLLHRVPAGLPDRVAALAEPMAVSVTALARAGVEAGDVVLIVGPGPVGILLAAGALAMGAATVVVAGRRDSDRLRFAGTVGSADGPRRLGGRAHQRPDRRPRGRPGHRRDRIGRGDRPRAQRGPAPRSVRGRGDERPAGRAGPMGSGRHARRRRDLLDELERDGLGRRRSRSSSEPRSSKACRTVFPLGDWEAAFAGRRAIGRSSRRSSTRRPAPSDDSGGHDPDHGLRPSIDRDRTGHGRGSRVPARGGRLPNRGGRHRRRHDQRGGRAHRPVRPDHRGGVARPAGLSGRGPVRRRTRHDRPRRRPPRWASGSSTCPTTARTRSPTMPWD